MAKKLQPLHWFPFPTDRWLGEIAGGLRADQKGALIDLLAVAYTQSPPCTLPDDDVYLAGKSGLGAKWKASRAAILATFTRTDDGRLVCGWLREIYDEQIVKFHNRSTANRENRRGSNPQTNGPTNRSANRGQEEEGKKEEENNRTDPSSSAAGVRPSAESVTPVNVAVWCNLAITDRWKEQPNPLTPAMAIQIAEEVAHVPWETVRDSIFAQCRASKSQKPPTHPNYFRSRVLQMHEEAQARRDVAGAKANDTPGVIPIGGRKATPGEQMFRTIMGGGDTAG